MFAAAIITLLYSLAAEPVPLAREQVSCAAASVYAVAQFEGAAVDLAEVCTRLPHTDAGNSIGEIIDAADELGVPLRAKQATKQLPSRPFIALQWPNGPAERTIGHFTAVRPIDRTGRQYQVIEPGKDPYVVEEQQILQDERFSGIVLVKRSRLTLVISIALLALGTVGFIATAVVYQRMRAQERAKETAA